jgi:hypothetical protein
MLRTGTSTMGSAKLKFPYCYTVATSKLASNTTPMLYAKHQTNKQSKKNKN